MFDWLLKDLILTMKEYRKEKPASNYAKHVQQLPTLRKEVMNTLTNQYSRSSLYHSGKENTDKAYLILHNQAYYRGEWANGLPDGSGYCIFSDGSYYQGKFVSGLADDKEGYLILSNGASYRGEVRQSLIEGEGEMRHNVGNDQSYNYKGSWKAGRPHGYGVQQYGDGSMYKGYFQNGVKHCFDPHKTIQEKEKQFADKLQLQHQSMYQSATGQTYTGEFFNGRMHGFGDYYRADKQIRYSGQFSNGRKQGRGSLHTQNGTLIGYFDKDLINGPGRFQWDKRDGRVYVGNFRNSKFHGEGRIELPNGNILEGTWEDGHSVQLKAVK